MSKVPGRLPDILRPLFWEFDFDRLAWPDDRDLVLSRILERGNWEATRWMLDVASAGGVRDWLISRRGRGVDRRRLRFFLFFSVLLDIPEEAVDQWLEELADEPWSGRLQRPA